MDQRDKDTGIVTWKLDLKPNEKRELLLQYKVKYPKSRKLVVLGEKDTYEPLCRDCYNKAVREDKEG